MLDLYQAAAVLLDLDGVITPTAEVHRLAWREAFDDYLTAVGVTGGFSDDDYLRFVDGKPRYDGVRSFLRSRSLSLPEGDPSDPPGHTTVQALGNLKNQAFRTVLHRHGIQPYPGSLRLLDRLEERGIPWAVVSSSANAREVLEAAGLAGRPRMVMDGTEARRRRLPGKPAPDTFVETAIALGATPPLAVVVEDALSGVVAGRSGGFGLVIGVAREIDSGRLLEAGADLVVEDLAELVTG